MALSTKSKLHWTCTPRLDPTKTTIIFLHAAWMSSEMFDETVAHLSSLLPNVNLLRIDLNGHGKTKAGRMAFTMWDQVEDVVALMVSCKCSDSQITSVKDITEDGLLIFF